MIRKSSSHFLRYQNWPKYMSNVMFTKRKAIDPNKIECTLGNDVENTFIS